MNFLHCLLHFHVQGNCSLGPLLAGVYLVLSGKYSSDSGFSGNESVREREWFLTSPLQAPTLPQHLSRLFIRCKHLRPTSLSALAHTFYVFTRVPAHRQVLEQLHLPPLWAPRQHPGYYLLSCSTCYWGLEPANVSSQEQHHSCDQVLPTQTLQRWVFITPLSLFTFTGFSFARLVGSSGYRIMTVKLFLKPPQSKTWIFKLAALNSARKVFSSWKG